MRKIQVLGIALVAMFAFSAIVASFASAETTLLAEWATGGVGVTATTNTIATGEIVLEDTKAGLGVTCSGSFVGTVSPNGEDKVTTILSLSEVEVTLAAPLLCKAHKSCEESTTDIEAAPEKLPWTTLLVLMENGSFLDITNGSGYFTACLVLGIKVSEECSSTETGYEIKNAVGGAEAINQISPKANCTVGGTEAGIVEFLSGNHLVTSPGKIAVEAISE